MESPVTPRRTRPSLLNNYLTGKLNNANRINQVNQILFKTTQNTVENFGLPLPVLVTETLTFADNNLHISARLSPDGWGWVVCGRRLLIWQYRERKQRNISFTPVSTPVTCYELSLPQTDLAHKANLVCVFNSDGNHIPSCIGVSPEGVIRYWHSVAHEGSYIEKTADLHGQECDCLTDSNPIGCVLATTTCTVVLVQYHTLGGRHNIITRTLQGSGGWLGGISRRVSSLFFSAMPTSHSIETKLVGVASLGNSIIDDEVRICVVAGLCAQLWHLGSPERLVAEIDLHRTLRDAFLHASMFPPGDPTSLDVHILDLQSWNNGLLLFVAAINTVRSPQIRYALAHMCTDEEGGTGQLLGFIPLQAAIGVGLRLGSETPAVGGPHMIATASTALLYDQSKVIIVSNLIPNDKPDTIELNINGDQILGAGLCYGIPLFFSKMHGVISIMSNDKMQDISLCDSPIASPRPSDTFDGHLSLYELDPRVIVEANETSGQNSTTEFLKAAFLHHMRREHTKSRALLNGLFPSGDEISVVNSLLDRTVLTIATDLVNDIPASDPRWSQVNIGNNGAALGSSSSMQIGLQLQDKRKAFSLLLEFLRASGLWSRFNGAAPPGADPAPTIILLRGIAEQLTAAIALRTLQQQSQHQHIIDTVIQQVIISSDESEVSDENSILSPSDVFYKNVSKVERALIQTVIWCNEQDSAGCAPPALSQLISKVNQVIVTVLQEVLKYRHQHAEFYALTASASKFELGNTTWTSRNEPNYLLSSLRSQQQLSMRRARHVSIELRAELKSQAVSIAAAALEFVKERVESFPINSKRRDIATTEYSQLRSEMIQPFIDDKDYEHATNLSEKFHDFDTLVLICEKLNNREKLYQYMDKFESFGFQQSAFRWFVNQGRGGQASLLKAFPHHSFALSQWLAEQGIESQTDEVDDIESNTDMKSDVPSLKETNLNAPTIDGTELLWLHELRADRWWQAASALLQLSENETSSVNRMTIQASLSKLCAYATSDENPELKSISEDIIDSANYKLLLTEHHQNLPSEIMTRNGINPDKLHVMEPRELIDMYITYSGTGLTEYDYSRALELCDLLSNSERNIGPRDILEFRRRLWCSIILIDSWDTYDKDSPLNTIQEKMFFKVVNAVHLMDCNLNEYLVPLDDLFNSKEVAELSKNATFIYLMKMGYEHVYHAENENMETS